MGCRDPPKFAGASQCHHQQSFSCGSNCYYLIYADNCLWLQFRYDDVINRISSPDPVCLPERATGPVTTRLCSAHIAFWLN